MSKTLQLYQYGMDVLEDLKSITHKSDEKLIEQLELCFSELCESVNKEHCIENYKILKGLYINEIKDLLSKLCKNLKNRDLIDIIIKENTKCKLIERFFDHISHIAKLIDCFSIDSHIKLIVEDSILKIEFDNYSLEFAEKNKALIYASIKSFLSNKIILTYEIHDKRDSKLTLNLDYSYNNQQYYVVKASDEFYSLMALPNIVQSYKLSLTQVQNVLDIDNLGCLEINNYLRSNLFNQIPAPYKKNLINSFSHKDLFYFPFPFRPFLWVMPGTGHLMDISPMYSVVDLTSGADPHAYFEKNSTLFYFDFFSIASY